MKINVSLGKLVAVIGPVMLGLGEALIRKRSCQDCITADLVCCRHVGGVEGGHSIVVVHSLPTEVRDFRFRNSVMPVGCVQRHTDQAVQVKVYLSSSFAIQSTRLLYR